MSAIFSRNLVRIAVVAALVVCKSGDAAEIAWSADIEDSLRRATENGQPVLMEFTADWCVFCKKMEKNTFTSPDVIDRISTDFVAVRVNADDNKDLVRELGIKGLPAILIVSPNMTVIERISGFQTPEALIPKLDAVTAAREKQATSARVASSDPATPPVKSRQSLKSVAAQQPVAADPAKVPPRPIRKAPEFKAISKEETPQASEKPIANPRQRESREIVARQAAPGQGDSAAADPESFFKTISRETPPDSQPSQVAPASFGGLCLVSAVDNRELVDGAAKNQVQFRGHTLYFSSPENKARFVAAPASYWPMIEGKCAMTLIDRDESVEGSLEFAAVFRNRIWLFSSREAMGEFLVAPAEIAEECMEHISESGR